MSHNGYTISKREREVLVAIALSKKSKQIAEVLGLSIHTINNQRKNILQKTGCSNASEMVLWGLRNGIIET